MVNKIKKDLYFAKIYTIIEKGKKQGKIVDFDEEIYNRLKDTYVFNIPVYFHIKYFQPNFGPGKCMDRSLMMDLMFTRSNFSTWR